MEVELKLTLADRIERDAVAACLAPITARRHQENRYYDDAARAWSVARWAVRLRREDDRAFLTVKSVATAPTAGPFVRRGEWERVLEAGEWDRLTAGGPPLGRAVRALLHRTARSPVALPSALDPDALRPLGAMTNVRAVAPLPGAGAALQVELDETSYPDGTIAWELELELDPGAGRSVQEEAERRLRAVLAQAGVPWRPSTVTKLQRLEAMLPGAGGAAPAPLTPPPER